MAPTVFISAGEASGDILAAGLVKALRVKEPSLSVVAMGGPALRAAGARIICDISEAGSVMGFSEIGKGFGKVIAAQREMKSALASLRPSLLVLVDYGDFNLRLAKYAKKLNVPVLYFVPPKVWAWRKWRLRDIAKNVDRAIVIYPYEQRFFEENGVKNVEYLGNPWTDEILDRREIQNYSLMRKEFLNRNGVRPSSKLIALFPGSRAHEVTSNLKPAIEGVKKLRSKHPEVEVIVAIAPGLTEEIRNFLATECDDCKEWVHLVSERSREVLTYSDSGLIKSGTSNIEAALAGLPFVMFFKTSWLTATIVKLVVRLREYSPVNIILPGTVRELLQEKVNPTDLALELEKVTFDPVERERQSNNFERIRNVLREGDLKEGETVYERCAIVASNMLKGEKVKRNIYGRVFRYVAPYRGTFLFALLCMILFGATDGVLPVLLKHVLDGVFQERNLDLLYAIPFAIIGFTLIRGVADFGQQYLMSKVGHNVVRDIRNQLNEHILKLSSDFFLVNSSASLLSRITSDVVLVRTLLTDAAAAILRDCVRVVALIISALYFDPVLATIAFIAFPLGIYPVYKFGKKMRKLSRIGQESIGALSTLLQESIVGQRVVKAFNREEYETKRFQGKNAELTKTFLKSERVRALTGPVNEVLASFAIAGVLFYGGLSVISQTRTQGDFIAFLIAMFLLYDPFKKLTRISSTVQQGISGAERIFEILDTEPKIVQSIATKTLNNRNDISIENVNFSYQPDQRQILSGINLQVMEGRKVALVGLSGAGKSTLIDLIPRFIDPTSGTVRIGGVDIKDVSFSELRSRIALVGQHTFLFNDTIFSNIAYGNQNASRDEVVAAAKAANAFDFISKLKDGFDTVVGEGGYSLSGGERQRISIARAILKDAPILILDEATASLDNKSEREVQRALEGLEQNRTCLIIAHRLSTIQNVDLIVVMKDGRIVEQGSHKDLLSKKQEYHKLYSLQFGAKENQNNEEFVN